ncbi:hypothetical protein C8R41DRAFT_871744 [Lentinula lateritia]|uniref:Uncharacterized protein n=1 Tax=Lentinula lateritia TaxID=40482 RepID=A0ABQ8UYG0_9AGAR|nr:hypothetical protein C8R41DRAFT_871744 [Lentinula lateritia]
MPTSMFNQRLPGVYIANPATTTHILVNWIQRKFVADTLNEGRLSENIYGHANDGSRFIWETQTLVLVCQLLHKVLSIIIHLVVRKNSRALNLNKRLRQIEYMNVSTHANLRRRFAFKTIHFKQEREPIPLALPDPGEQFRHPLLSNRASQAESKVFMMWMRLKIASRNFNDKIDKPSSRSNVLDSTCETPRYYSWRKVEIVALLIASYSGNDLKKGERPQMKHSENLIVCAIFQSSDIDEGQSTQVAVRHTTRN